MGGGYDSLWELYRLHHGHTGGTDTPRPVAKTLCAAFLADLRADFNDSPLLHGQRPRNCLLLLDNAGGRAGDLFLELIAECRREHGTAACDPAVVVAVQRGRVRHRTIEPLEPTDERLDFDVRHPGAPSDEDHPVWWYPVRLADLDKESVAELSRSGVLGTRNRDADFLYALTGGHPESAARLSPGCWRGSAGPRRTTRGCCWASGNCPAKGARTARTTPPSRSTCCGARSATTSGRGRTAASPPGTTRCWTPWRCSR